MEFTRKNRNRLERKNVEVENLANLYPHNIMIYRMPPLEEISIFEFEDLALERLKVMRAFEYANSKGLRAGSDDYVDAIKAELNLGNLKGYLRLILGGTGTNKESDLQARRRDYLSHFILRLAYCRSEEYKRWFMDRELELFRMKFSFLGQKEIKQFLKLNNLNYVPLTDEQKEEVYSGLSESTMNAKSQNVSSSDYYKVHFSDVFDLIRGRKCYLKQGYAYVCSADFVSIVSAKQQKEIQDGLNAANRILPQLENDERLHFLLKGLHKSYTGKDYTVSKNAAVPIESIDQLSKKSFPLCMRMCHEGLRSANHLKHGGRMQYGLFLKGIGVTLEDSLRFWREEFTKKMDPEKFQKSYAYNIRHNYGKEGAMRNYTPYSCISVIQTSVGPGDTHGCPFKIFDAITLKNKLTSLGVGTAHAQEILAFANKDHYQLACGRYFEITHNTKLEVGINHPNGYFEKSQELMGNRVHEKNTAKNIQAGAVNRQRQVMQRQKNLMDAGDDKALMEVTETQESEYSTQMAKEDWSDDDFNVALVN